MHRALAVALVAIACRPLPPRGTAEAVVAQALPRLVLDVDPSAPVACVQASVRAGAAFDPLGHEGTAWLVAQLQADAAAQAGLPRPEVEVGPEDVTFRLSCASGTVDACTAALRKALVDPAFTTDGLERARALAVARLTSGSHDTLADAVLDAWVFEAHPYGHPAEGRTGVLPVLDVLDLRTFHAAHDVRAATVVGVGGAATLDQARALVAELGGLGGTQVPDLPLFHALPPLGRKLLVVDAPGTGVHLRLGEAVDLGADETPTALLAGVAALRVATGLDVDVVGLDPVPGAHRRRPMLRIRLPELPVDAAPAALRAALTALGAVATAVDDEALRQGVETLATGLRAQAADPCARLAAQVDAVVTGGPDAQRVLPDLLERVTLAEARAALANHLDPRALRLVAVGPGERPLADALVAPGPDGVDVLGPVEAFVRPAEGVFR